MKNKKKEIILTKKEFSELVDEMRGKPYLTPGTKVKLDYERISSHSFWKNGNSFYKDFVNENKDKTFTLRLLKNLENNPVVFGLISEDGIKSDFTFHESDLIVID